MGLSNIVYENIAQFGYIGVDIFFVISGFIMAKSTENLKHNLKSSLNFISKRFLRIYLGYLPILILAIIIYSFLIPDILAKKDILSSLFLVTTNMNKLVLGTAWSLPYELYFYIILSFILLTTFINKKVFLSVLGLCVIAKLAFIQNANHYVNFFLSHFLLEFIAGYFIFSFKYLLVYKNMIAVLLVLALMAFIVGSNLPIADDWTRIASFGLFATALVGLLYNLEKNKILSLME